MNTLPMKRLFVAAAVALLVFSLGCKRKTPPDAAATPPAAKTVAVAPFSNPRADFELLAGYLPEDAPAVSEGVPGKLDEVFTGILAADSKIRTISPSAVGGCLKTEPREESGGRLGTLKYWQDIGACSGSQYVLVPQVLGWQEREGSAVGTTVPAAVNINFYLLDVKTGGVVKFFHFDEQQRALADNLLEAGKFFERKGRWLTAYELAAEGMRAALREFGL